MVNLFLFACGLIGNSRGSQKDAWSTEDVTADWFMEESLDELCNVPGYKCIRLPGIRLWLNQRSYALSIDGRELL